VECSPGEIVWKRQGLQQSPQLNNWKCYLYNTYSRYVLNTYEASHYSRCGTKHWMKQRNYALVKGNSEKYSHAMKGQTTQRKRKKWRMLGVWLLLPMGVGRDDVTFDRGWYHIWLGMMWHLSRGLQMDGNRLGRRMVGVKASIFVILSQVNFLCN
jgi:hypothetical protein